MARALPSVEAQSMASQTWSGKAKDWGVDPSSLGNPAKRTFYDVAELRGTIPLVGIFGGEMVRTGGIVKPFQFMGS